MPKYLILPKIGMNMEEAVISEWLVQPGDRVEKEQMVVRAETDKAVQDLFATESGIVRWSSPAMWCPASSGLPC